MGKARERIEEEKLNNAVKKKTTVKSDNNINGVYGGYNINAYKKTETPKVEQTNWSEVKNNLYSRGTNISKDEADSYISQIKTEQKNDSSKRDWTENEISNSKARKDVLNYLTDVKKINKGIVKKDEKYKDVTYDPSFDYAQEVNNKEKIINDINSKYAVNNTNQPYQTPQQKQTMSEEDKALFAKTSSELETLRKQRDKQQADAYKQYSQDNFQQVDETNEEDLHNFAQNYNNLGERFGASTLRAINSIPKTATSAWDWAKEGTFTLANDRMKNRLNNGEITQQEYDEWYKDAYFNSQDPNNASQQFKKAEEQLQVTEFAGLNDEEIKGLQAVDGAINNLVNYGFYGGLADTFGASQKLIGDAVTLGMSASSATDTYMENIANGMDVGTASLNAGLKGVVSFLTERIPAQNFVEAWSNPMGKMSFGKLAKMIGGQSWSEGREEGYEYGADVLIDALTTTIQKGGDLGFFINQVIDNFDAEELVTSMELGMASGAIIGTLSSAKGAVGNVKQYNKFAEMSKVLGNDIEVLKNYGDIDGANKLQETKDAIDLACNDFEEKASNVSKGVSFESDSVKSAKLTDGIQDFNTAIQPDYDAINKRRAEAYGVAQALLNERGIDADIEEYMSWSDYERNNVATADPEVKKLVEKGYKIRYTNTLGKGVNALYLGNNQIALNPNSDTPLASLVHEVLHSVEKGNKTNLTKLVNTHLQDIYKNPSINQQAYDNLEMGKYKTFKKFQDGYNKKISDTYIKAINNYNKKHHTNVRFNNETLTSEYLANTIENTLGQDKKFIDKMVKYDSSLVYRMFQKIKSLGDNSSLNNLQNAFYEAFKNNNIDPETGTKLSINTDDNYGYNYGNYIFDTLTDDSKKSETTKYGGYGRSTGHFGTGTYFFGEQKDGGYRGSNNEHKVDFSDYNLYKVKDDQNGYALHDYLKLINRWSEYNGKKLSIEEQISLNRKIKELVDEHGEIKTDTFDMWSEFDKNNPSPKYEEKYDEDGRKTEKYKKYLEKELQFQNELKEKYGYYDNYDEINKLFNEYFSKDAPDINEPYGKRNILDALEENIINSKDFERFEESYYGVKKLRDILGYKFTEEEIMNAYEKAKSVYKNNLSLDLPSTTFMKALGYEGVDARGTGLDNGGYGSVIYDLKPQTILYSINLKDSQDYNQAVKEGDVAKQQELVDKVAERNGYTIDGYHGSKVSNITTFKPSQNKSQFGDYKFGNHEVTYITSNKKTALGYTNMGIEENGNVYHVKAKIDNPLVINQEGIESPSWKGIKNQEIRDLQLRFFDNFKTVWEDNPLYIKDNLKSLNDDLFPLGYYLKENEEGYYDLYNADNNTMFGGTKKAPSLETINEIFDFGGIEELQDDFDPDDYYYTIDDITRVILYANDNGITNYDGIVVPDIQDIGPTGSWEYSPTTDYVILGPNNIKSADPITYNDNGEIVPLEERFNSNNDDMRFSINMNDNTDEDENDIDEATREIIEQIKNSNLKPEIKDRLIAQGKESGFMEAGSNPQTQAFIPNEVEVDGEMKKNSESIRTFAEADLIKSKKLLDSVYKDVVNGQYAYNDTTTLKELAKAKDKFDSTGIDAGFNSWIRKKNVRISEIQSYIAEGELLAITFSKANDKRLGSVLMKLKEASVGTAQGLNMYKIAKKLSPEVQYELMMTSVNNLIENWREKYGDKKVADIAPNEELLTKFKNAKNSEERANIEKEIISDLMAKSPSNLIDKANEIRYLSMLGNPRTHVRNLVGNTVMGAMALNKDIIGTGLESLFATEGGKKLANKMFGREAEGKTKSVFNLATKEGRQEFNSLVKFGGQTCDQYKDSLSKQKFENVNNVGKFSNDNIVGKSINKLSAGNSFLLEAEDYLFSKAKFALSFAGYLKANGWTESTITEVQKNQAIQYSLNEANKATFRDYNAYADWLNRLPKNSKVGNFLKDAIIPFTTTPFNIVRRGVEYSPIGLMNTITKGWYEAKTGKITVNQWIDNMASGLTGTGLFFLGMILRSAGIIRTKDDDKNRKKYFDQENGEQDYAIVTDKGTYTLDWLTPAIMAISMGAEFARLSEPSTFGSDKSLIEIAEKVITRVVDPIVETSMMSNVKNSLQSFSSDPAEYFLGVGESAVADYISQFFPTLGGQIARTIDDTRRTTSPSKNIVDKTAKSIKNKIPFLSMTNEPYINKQGQEEKTEDLGMDFVGRAFLNMVSPGYYSAKDIDKYDEEMYRLYDKTGDLDALPTDMTKEVTFNGQKYKLYDEDFTKHAQTKYQLETQNVNELMDSSNYRKLDDSTKVKAISSIRDLAKLEAKAEYLNTQGHKLESEDGQYANWLEAKKSGISMSEYVLSKMAYDNSNGDNKQSDFINNLDNLGLSDKEKNAMYDQYYGESNFSKAVNGLNISDEEKYNIKQIKSQTSSSQEFANQLRENGLLDKLVEYCDENDIEYSKVGLSKSAVKSNKTNNNSYSGDEDYKNYGSYAEYYRSRKKTTNNSNIKNSYSDDDYKNYSSYADYYYSTR